MSGVAEETARAAGFVPRSDTSAIQKTLMSAALRLERGFVSALRLLDGHYRSALGARSDLLGGIAELRAAAETALARLEAHEEMGALAWIGCVYHGLPEYRAAYETFFSVQQNCMAQIYSQYSTSEDFRKTMKQTQVAVRKRELPLASLSFFQLLAYCSTRIKHLSQLISEQFAVARQSDHVMNMACNAVYYAIKASPAPESSKKAICQKTVASMHGASSLKDIEASVAETQSIENLGAPVAQFYSEKAVELSIDIPANGVPANAERTLIAKIRCTHIESGVYGFNRSTPMHLFVFNDGCILATANPKAEQYPGLDYLFVAWLDKAVLTWQEAPTALIPTCLERFKKQKTILLCQYKHHFVDDAAVSRTTGSGSHKPDKRLSMGEKSHKSEKRASIHKDTKNEKRASKSVKRMSGFGFLRKSIKCPTIELCEANTRSTYVLSIFRKDTELWDKASEHIHYDMTPCAPEDNVYEEVDSFIPAFHSEVETLVNYEKVIHNSHDVPFLIRTLVNKVAVNGLAERGIFRESVEKALLEKLEKGINAGHLREDILDECDNHTAANLIRLFFREMPQALVPADLVPRFIRMLDLPTKEKQIVEIQSLLGLMGDNQRALLRTLIVICRIFSANSQFNQMTNANLSVVFSQTVFLDNSVTQPQVHEVIALGNVTRLMMEYAESLFENMRLPSTVDCLIPQDNIFHFRLKQLLHKAPIRGMVCDETAGKVFVLDDQGFISYWDLRTGRFLEMFTSAAEMPIGFVMCKGIMFTYSRNLGQVMMFDSKRLPEPRPDTVGCLKWEPVATKSIENCECLATSPNGEVWFGGTNCLYAFSPKSLSCVDEIRLPGKTVLALCGVNGNNNGVMCACCSSPSSRNLELLFMNANPRRILHTVSAGLKTVTSVTTLGDFIAVASKNGEIKVWETVSQFEPILAATLQQGTSPICEMVALPDMLLTCSIDKSVFVWSLPHMKFIGTLAGYHNRSVCTHCVGDPNIPENNNIMLWTAGEDMGVVQFEVSPLSSYFT